MNSAVSVLTREGLKLQGSLLAPPARKVLAAIADLSSAGLPQGMGTHLLHGVSQAAGTMPHIILLIFQMMGEMGQSRSISLLMTPGWDTAVITLSQSAPM